MTSMSAEMPVVLVVDDDASVCRALARLIRAAGFQARTFHTPGELLASEIPRANACFVFDVNLPEMDGVTLAETLMESGRGLPVIMITGRSDFQTRGLLEKAHAQAVLFKPFDQTVLLDAIKHAVFGPAIEV